MDPGLLVEELEQRARHGRLPAAVIVVDLYGQSADYDPIVEACARFEVPLIEDAAEGAGRHLPGAALRLVRRAGRALVQRQQDHHHQRWRHARVPPRASSSARARHLATQAREPVPHYEHRSIGYNYRLSNLLAALGRGQLRGLDERVAPAAGEQPAATGRRSPTWRASRSCRWPTTASRPAGSP